MVAGKEVAQEPRERRERIARWVVRVVFFVVFAVNVDCAVSFIADPGAYAGSYELAGVAGEAAVRGLGVAFLMWNVTYPAFILRPEKWPVLGWVILAQQAVGLVGESLILAGLPAGHAVLAAGIRLFIVFDGAGLVAMAAAFAWWMAERRLIANAQVRRSFDCGAEGASAQDGTKDGGGL